MSAASFSANGSNIVHEVFDDEVIVANLETGTYYALKREAADLWKWALQGATADEIASALAQKYSGDPTVISSAAKAFLDRLQAEGLLRAGLADASRAPLALSVEVPASRPAFAAPEIEVHRDLQDLLLLDPIHEVGPEGWPTRK